jgi:hypothetical protein
MQARENNGRFSFATDAMCTCGHTFGAHASADPHDCTECAGAYLCDGFMRAVDGRVPDRSIAFPTSKLTKNEIADGWVLCADPTCKPTTGGRRIIGTHAHPLVLAKESR